jgi:cobalt/nickel transport system permease protein
LNAPMTLVLAPPPVADSPIARLDARWRFAALALAAAGAAAVRSLGPALAALSIAMLFAAVARLPARWLLRRLGALAAALLPFAVIMPLMDGMAGARLAGLLAAKAITVAAFSLTALGSAPVPVTLHAARALGLPRTLIHVLLLSYRYLFLLADELDRLRRTVRVRGFRPLMDRHSYRTVGHVIGTLVVRGTERAEGVAHAMRCRGFDGRFHSLATFRTTTADVAFFAVSIAMTIGVVTWDLTG